jgi:hypothetical protein
MDVKINKGKLDNATYLKMKQIKKIIGILTQQIQLKLGELKKQNKMDAHMQAQRRFREIAKEILDEKTFNQIIERLKSESVSKI